MNCIEARRMVTPFVKKELSDKDTEAFLEHVACCRDCMDELDIYYTVYHVLNLLDSGSHHEYDFRKMLEEDIRATRRNLLRKRFFVWARRVSCLAVGLLLLLTVITGMRVRAGEDGLLRNMLQRVQLIWTQTEPEAQNGAGTEPQAETGTEERTAPRPETGTEAGTGTQEEPGTEIQAGTGTEAGTEI